MPYFSDQKVFFIHIPKNAGRSVEASLLPEGLTPDSGRRGLLNRAATLFQRATESRVAHKYLLGTLDVALMSQHLTYSEAYLLGLLPPDFQMEARVFAVVRNPYSRIVSSVNHFARKLHGSTGIRIARNAKEMERQVAAWLELRPVDHNELAHRRPQVHYVTRVDLSGQPPVDILRFEEISRQFASYAASNNLQIRPMKTIGASKENRGVEIDEILNAAAKRKIQSEYACDFEAFDYEI